MKAGTKRAQARAKAKAIKAARMSKAGREVQLRAEAGVPQPHRAVGLRGARAEALAVADRSPARPAGWVGDLLSVILVLVGLWLAIGDWP